MESRSKKPANDIRVSYNTRVGGIVSYCEKLIKDNKERTLNFSAVGGSIGTLVNAVEVLKAVIPGLYQVNRLVTISYQSVEEGKQTENQNQRLYPKLEVILTLDKPEKQGEGFQDKLSEEDRKKIQDIQNKRREENRNRPPRRGGFRGSRRRGFRGRGGFRGRRPMGQRGPVRGGFRGRGFRANRGGPRRGGFRGNRGAPRGRGRQPRN